MSQRHLKLGAILAGVGIPQNGWRHPALPGDASIDIGWYRAALLTRVLPLLRERGLVRSEHEQDTLRGRLGLPIPKNRHTTQPEADPGRQRAIQSAPAPAHV